MGKRYLIDSSAYSKHLTGYLTDESMQFMADLSENNISVITKIELFSWISDDFIEKAVTEFVDNATVIELTDEIINKTIEIRRKVKVKLPDTIIAATAIVNKMTLLSCNDSDFLKIPKLKYISIH